MARVTLVTVSTTFLFTDELLGPSDAPCGLDPGCYLPSPCPQVLLPVDRLPAGSIEASSPRRSQQLFLQWPVSKGSTQQTTVGAVVSCPLSTAHSRTPSWPCHPGHRDSAH